MTSVSAHAHVVRVMHVRPLPELKLDTPAHYEGLREAVRLKAEQSS